MVLEICCYNLPSCMVAVQAGADRIELCADYAEGGTTPSYGTIRLALAATRRAAPTPTSPRGVRLYPIIRPRGGGLCYYQRRCQNAT